jgi:hypothetical protein
MGWNEIEKLRWFPYPIWIGGFDNVISKGVESSIKFNLVVLESKNGIEFGDAKF